MSVIFSCNVSSVPPRIKLDWGGTRNLVDGREFVPGSSTAQGPSASGASSTNPLTHWAVARLSRNFDIPRDAGVKNRYEIVLVPQGSRLGQPVFMPVAGTYVEFKFDFGDGVPAQAQVIVDAGGADGQIANDLQLLTGFPFQVYDGSVTTAAPAPMGGSAGVAPAGAQATIDAQMRAILGRNAGSGGLTATLAALDRSFQLVDSDGVETWTWQPRSYAVQSDIGAGVTGEQASLARLATSVGDEIVPLVNGLTPLLPEFSVNPDEIAAARVIFNESWPAFVAEIGADGGPRIPRATSLLQDAAVQLVTLGILLGVYESGVSLTNTRPGSGSAAAVQFNPFRLDTWPQPDRANGVVTGDDEENYTNFVIASDRVQLVIGQFASLYVGTPSGAPTLLGAEDRGFLVVLLQRALDATGEAADAVYAALDSVNLGQDERELIYIPGTGPTGASTNGLLSVEDIISWAASFPAEAGSLLQSAGNIGVASIRNRASDLESAVSSLQTFAVPGVSPSGLGHPRVTYALDVLADTLTDVNKYASDPGLTYATPTTP